MIFTEVPLADAVGGLLAHSLLVGGQRWAKGRVLSDADVAAASAAGLAALTIARLEPGDLGEDAAAVRLAARLAGPGLVALAPVHGRVNLAASAAGVFVADAAMVAAVNSVDEALTLATLAPGARVAAGEIVATIKTIRYAVSEHALSTAEEAARPLSLAGFATRNIAFLATTLSGTADKALAKTARVTKARVESLGCASRNCPPARTTRRRWPNGCGRCRRTTCC